MPAAVRLIFVAWLCYSTAIWSEKRQKELKRWMLIIFILGFLIDFSSTSIMSIQHPGFSTTTHGRIGQGALVFMFFHLLAAIVVIWKKGCWQQLFTRCSVYAWGLWTLALVTGPFVR